VNGRMGDVIEVDLADMLARSWLGLPATGTLIGESEKLYDLEKA
jgi:hypothetical protein